MKKYIGCAAIAILSISLLTGCGSGIELTDAENDMVAEYMATVLLKYDSEYEEELIYTEATEESEEEHFTPVDSMDSTDSTGQEASGEKPASGETGIASEEDNQPGENSGGAASVTLGDIFDNKKYEVSYAGVKEYDSYKEKNNDYFVVEAPSGCKLAVVQFKITNISDKSVKVDLAEEGITYELSGEGITSAKPLLTALTGDLQYYNETIPAGESKMAVVVFAIDKKADASGGTLTISKKGNRAAVSLK